MQAYAAMLEVIYLLYSKPISYNSILLTPVQLSNFLRECHFAVPQANALTVTV